MQMNSMRYMHKLKNIILDIGNIRMDQGENKSAPTILLYLLEFESNSPSIRKIAMREVRWVKTDIKLFMCKE